MSAPASILTQHHPRFMWSAWSIDVDKVHVESRGHVSAELAIAAVRSILFEREYYRFHNGKTVKT